MKLRKVVLAVLVFCLVTVGAAMADPECHEGIGSYDECGNWHCNYVGSGGNCLLCWDEIVVKG